MKKGKKDTKKGKNPEDMDEVETDEDEDEDMGKSDLSTDDLEKAMAELEEQAGQSPQSRRDELLEKASEGELEKSEREELYELLGGDEPAGRPLSDDVTKGFRDNEDLVKGIEVSDFLRENTDELVKSLGHLSDTIESQDKRQHNFNMSLSKAMVTVGRLTAELARVVKTIGDQPARGPKSVRNPAQAKPLAKSFGGETETDGPRLTRTLVMDALEGMLQKSMNEGRGGRSRTGKDIGLAITQFEGSNEIAPSLLREVQAEIAANTGQNPQDLH